MRKSDVKTSHSDNGGQEMKGRQMTRNERRRYRRKLREQRLIGLAVLVCCAAMFWLCSTGRTLGDRDATAVLLLVPLGLWMLVTKEIIIY